MKKQTSKVLAKIMMIALSVNLFTGAIPIASYASETDQAEQPIIENEGTIEEDNPESSAESDIMIPESEIEFAGEDTFAENDTLADSTDPQQDGTEEGFIENTSTSEGQEEGNADDELLWTSGDVFIPASSIGFVTYKATMTVGDSGYMSAEVLPYDASNPGIRWSSSDESLATITQEGYIEAKGAGTVQITIETMDGTNFSQTANIRIKPLLASNITISDSTLTLNTGDTAALSATVLPENTGNKTVKWTSKDTRVVTVDQNGVVTAVGSGTARIAASTTDGSYLSAYCDVTVTDIKATSITLEYDKLTITEGNTAQFIATILPENTTNKRLRWTTTNGVVASVTQEGVITARRAGQCTIAVKTQDGTNLQAKCRVTVIEGTDPVTSVTLDKDSLVLNKGESASLVATVLPADAQNPSLKWESSNEYVASVNVSGVVTALHDGTAVIKATTKDGTKISATCTVTVNGIKATGLKLNKTAITLSVNGTETLTPTFTPADVDNKVPTWTSADTNIATVDQFGTITGVAEGTTTITATTRDGTNLSASCTVTVDGNLTLITMHRLYNRRSGEHFYTSNTYERDVLVSRGWTYEGIAWKAPDTTQFPVYRMYNPKSKAHHYTMSENERDTLCGLGKFRGRGKGWNDEGIGWYSAQSADSIQQLSPEEQNKYMPLHRLYNPKYPMVSAHHYTADEHEVSVLLTRGWVYEGIAWYGIR